jgi:acetylornithine/N-succinyldiaminopimelate aminotransferase
MEREHLTEHVKEITPYLEEKLDELVKTFDFLTTRRGLGLMQGVVCEKPVGQIASKALEKGLIVITAGSDVLRFVPPLIIEKQHVDEMAEKLYSVLSEM